MIGCALLAAPFLRAFQHKEGARWAPQSSMMFGFWLLVPLTIIYVAANAFILILSFFPSNLQSLNSSSVPGLPWYTTPVAGMSIITFGILWWAWDRHILPALGYHFDTKENKHYSRKWKDNTLRVTFEVSN